MMSSSVESLACWAPRRTASREKLPCTTNAIVSHRRQNHGVVLGGGIGKVPWGDEARARSLRDRKNGIVRISANACMASRAQSEDEDHNVQARWGSRIAA